MRATVFGRSFGFLALAVAVAIACSASEESDPPRGTPMSSGATAGTIDLGEGGGATTGRGGSSSIGIGSGGDGDPGLSFAGACAAEITKGEVIPLDVHIMLDTSGSLLVPTGLGTNNWTAIKDALEAFLLDPGSDGIGVGIQYFPLPAPGVPATCTMDADCGDAGPCDINDRICYNDSSRACASAAQCNPPGPADFGPCTRTVCSGQPYLLCPAPGFQCVDIYGNDFGTCEEPPGKCIQSASCDAADYSTPAEEIQALPDAAEVILDSINAQMPAGNTPSAAALGGALTYAGAWAADHPTHTVVTLFATDGLPTQCQPQDFPTIAALATDAFEATPSVSTYVVGVFPPDNPAVQQSLDLIADAGGTEQAFMIDTSQDVAEQFLAALNAIRGTRLDCEFQVPEAPDGQTLDYNYVNVQFSADGSTELLGYVASADDCGVTQGGWYYDVDPADGDAPTKILVCPSTCEAFQGAVDGQVEIALGCETVPAVVK
ncbi:MAG TPA: hypothetical protein VM686_14240 [Polyangiaceae bacterium]|nr:hypothetical protein [Polyangiaceae bacterium]